MTWPEPVERVTAVLREASVESRVEEFAQATSTAVEAARAIGCDASRIAKSLLFLCDGRPLLVLVPGDRRADLRKVAQAVGAERVRVAQAEEVERRTGFAPGAVAPFPLRDVERVLIDRLLLTDEVVWIGAGSSRHLAALPPSELVRVTRGVPVDVAEDG